ncbi:hypothetical protein ANN_07545 [Periplaneta americana]|uniref:Uncharacterized protein n=1 Tax=Periplaneta americana TaxID=6978 RepID=A0ABQ8SYZ8_PERAM|nr:hypothetical protein ANN_07545 [Periplaneta americana]
MSPGSSTESYPAFARIGLRENPGKNLNQENFGAKRDEVTGGWRKLHNAELHALYSSPDMIRNIKSRHLRWAGHVARMGESRNAYRVLVGRPEGKRPLGRPRRRWEDNIQMDLREVGYDDREWMNLAQDRDQWRAYVRVAMNLRSLMLAGSEFQSLGRAIVKEDEYEEVRWDENWCGLEREKTVRNLYIKKRLKVRIGDEMSEGSEIGRGVRRGCLLPPTLFNIYLED